METLENNHNSSGLPNETQHQTNSVASVQQSVFPKKCKIHSQNPCDLLILNSPEKDIFACFQCLQAQKMDISNVICINQVLSASSDDILETYPVLSNPNILGRIKELTFSNKIDEITLQISNFFGRFRSQINEDILTAEKKSKEQICKIYTSYRNMKENLKTTANIEGFKAAVCSNEEDVLKSFLLEHLQNIQKNSDLLEFSVAEYSNLLEEFTLEKAQQDVLELSQLLERITFFKSLDSEYVKQQQKEQQLEARIKELEEKQQQLIEQHNLDLQSANLAAEQSQQQNQIAEKELNKIILSQKETLEKFEQETEIKRNYIKVILKPILQQARQMSQNISYKSKSKSYIQTNQGNYVGETNEEDNYHGIGTFTWKNGNTYEGQWQDNKQSGFGVFTYQNGDYYEGQFEDGMFDGMGTLYSNEHTIKKDGIFYENKLIDEFTLSNINQRHRRY